MPILVNISKQCKVEIIAIDVPVSVLRTMAAYLEVRKTTHSVCVCVIGATSVCVGVRAANHTIYLEVCRTTCKAIQYKTCAIRPDVIENLNSGFFSMICSLKRKMRSRPASVQ